MDGPSKRDRRREKRDVKKAGVRRARRVFRHLLAGDPEAAPETGLDFGRLTSAPYNGLDKDPTRLRKETGEVDRA